MFFEVLAFLGIKAIGYKLNTKTGVSQADKYGVYRDGNGNYRLKDNGHWVVETTNSYGERIVKNVRNGIEEINIDEIEAGERLKQAVREGKRFYLFRKDINRYSSYKYGDKRIIGDRYKKVEGPGIFVKREIKYKNLVTEPEFKCWYSGEYYMDAYNYKIYLPTEEQNKIDKEKYGEKYIKLQDHIMELANEKIQKIKETDSELFLPNEDYPIYIGNEETSARYEAASKSISRWR